MRWFFDTEFHEDGKVIDLISIGMVGVDPSGEVPDVEFYAVSTEFNPNVCNDWVKINVLPKLPSRVHGSWKSRGEIASNILEIVNANMAPGNPPEFWGYFADYDWVLFCQLFGRMIDLPKGWPQYCLDIKQLMHENAISKRLLPANPEADAHDALVDARWTRRAYDAIRDIMASRVMAFGDAQ